MFSQAGLSQILPKYIWRTYGKLLWMLIMTDELVDSVRGLKCRALHGVFASIRTAMSDASTPTNVKVYALSTSEAVGIHYTYTSLC